MSPWGYWLPHQPSASVAATNPAKIQELAAGAYVWGVAPEFVYRFANYNELVTAPRNTLGGGNAPAAWNNQGTNAGDASALYLKAFLDLSGQKGRRGSKQLVLTVPPSNANYYIVNLLDAFINTVGSIGTRTTPSTRTSRDVGQLLAVILQHRSRMRSLTRFSWARLIALLTLVPAAALVHAEHTGRRRQTTASLENAKSEPTVPWARAA